ncbi:MAG: N-acyl amino acid synthase FeeM domain-containing protein [Candidatus Dormibacteria bacterium]
MPTPEAIESSGTTSELDSLLLPDDAAQDAGLIASFLTAMPQSLAAKVPAASPGAEGSCECRRFWIRFANTDERREKAALLIARMYASQGYKHEDIVPETCHAITLISHGPEGNVIATITISMDSPEGGLLADQGHRGELDRLRAQGKKLCEFNGFAVDPTVRSRLALARLFHIAMLYPWGLLGRTDCVIEVHPRHAGFYERMLLFKRIGEARVCSRVGAVGVLLHADFGDMMERLDQVGGLMEKAAGDRSLYPYGFSKADAEGILGRLKRGA